MWKRNQTSEAQVHAVYKPSFSLSSEYMQQFFFEPNKNYGTLAFSLENCSLGFQFGLNLSMQIKCDGQHIHLCARVLSSLRGDFNECFPDPESWCCRSEKAVKRRENQGESWVADNCLVLPRAETSAWELRSRLHAFTRRSAAHTTCWCFPGSFADITGIRTGLSRPNLLINNACVCSGSFPVRSEPSSSKSFSAESESIHAIQPVSIVCHLWHFCSKKVHCANTIMPSYSDVPSSEETFGQDLC